MITIKQLRRVFAGIILVTTAVSVGQAIRATNAQASAEEQYEANLDLIAQVDQLDTRLAPPPRERGT